MNEQIEKSIKCLFGNFTELEKEVFDSYYIKNSLAEDIANSLEISTEEVEQVICDIKTKIQNAITSIRK